MRTIATGDPVACVSQFTFLIVAVGTATFTTLLFRRNSRTRVAYRVTVHFSSLTDEWEHAQQRPSVKI